MYSLSKVYREQSQKEKTSCEWSGIPPWCQGSGVRVGRLVGHHTEAIAAQKTTGYHWWLPNSISERKTQPTKPTRWPRQDVPNIVANQCMEERSNLCLPLLKLLILTSIVPFLLRTLFFFPSRKQKKWLSVQCLSHKLASKSFFALSNFFIVCPLKAWLMHLCGHFALWRSEKPKRVSSEHLCVVTDRFQSETETATFRTLRQP